MTWKKNVRNAGITLSAATLGLLAAEGAAGAHDSYSPPDQVYGTVTAVGTDSVTVQTPGGTSQTVTTTPSTTYKEAGTSAVPTVADGDHVDVTLDPTDTTPTATTITVLLDRVSGRVVDVDGSTVRLAERHGFRDFLTTASTTYSGGPSTSTGLIPGEYVTAFGLPSSSTSSEIVAQFVDIVSKKVPTPPRPVPVKPRPVSTPPTWSPGPVTPRTTPTTAAVTNPSTTSGTTDPGAKWNQDPPRSNPAPSPQPQPGPGRPGPGNGPGNGGGPGAAGGRGGGSFGGR